MKLLSVPIFPLTGVIFFPGSSLPLNIFEKKYISMIDYSLSKDKLIGMIQSNENNKLYDIGCIGKINSYEETTDGRYIINLSGKNYFKIVKELSKKNNFRIAEIEILKQNKKYFVDNNIFDRNSFLQKYKTYSNEYNIKIDFTLLNQIESLDLIRFAAMSCPFSSADKQMLLETFDINELGNKMIYLFDFYISNKEKKDRLN